MKQLNWVGTSLFIASPSWSSSSSFQCTWKLNHYIIIIIMNQFSFKFSIAAPIPYSISIFQFFLPKYIRFAWKTRKMKPRGLYFFCRQIKLAWRERMSLEHRGMINFLLFITNNRGKLETRICNTYIMMMRLYVQKRWSWVLQWCYNFEVVSNYRSFNIAQNLRNHNQT